MSNVFRTDMWGPISSPHIGIAKGILARAKACFYVVFSRRGNIAMDPVSLSFEDYLTTDYGNVWESPFDLRYLFDGLAILPGLVWVTRGDPFHPRPQLTGIGAFEWDEETPIEFRLFETPDLDTVTWYLVTAELNRRNRVDDRLVDIHAHRHQSLINALPKVNVDYVGRA